ncbi:MAG: hypothetical protein AAGI53_03115 [Planctomycetota bacterium]
MRQSTRLVVNSLAMYAKTLGSVALALITTRLVIGELGLADYGVFLAVGATGGLFMVASNGLTQAASRHMSFEVGTGDDRALREYFNSALVLFAIIASVLLVLGWFGGPLVVSALTVPEGRESAAAWVVFSTAAMFAIITLETAFTAIAVAYQKHYLQALTGFITVLVRFIGALLLAFVTGDALVWYAWIVVVAHLVSFGLVIFLVMRSVPTARVEPSLFRMHRVRKLVTYGGWSLVGTLSWRARMQGAVIMLNILFGPIVNASYGIATQLAAFQSRMTGPIRRATQPAIVSAHGGEKTGMTRDLTLMAGKYISVAGAVILFPIAFEAETIISLWLGAERLEELTGVVGLMRGIAAWMTLGFLAAGLGLANQAEGRIATLSIVTVLFDAAALGGALAVIKLGWNDPIAVPLTTVVTMSGLVLFHVFHVGPKVGITFVDWAVGTLWPTAIAFTVGLGAAFAVEAAMPPGPVRALVLSGVTGAGLVGALYAFGMDDRERQHFRRLAGGVLRKVTGRKSGRKGAGGGEAPAGSG